jgi:thymidylate synthase
MERKDVPCLQFVQFWVEDNKLNMYVLFRSNDVLSALGANAFALTALQNHVACQILAMVGKLYYSIVLPHYYPCRDAEELKEAIR